MLRAGAVSRRAIQEKTQRSDTQTLLARTEFNMGGWRQTSRVIALSGGGERRRSRWAAQDGLATPPQLHAGLYETASRGIDASIAVGDIQTWSDISQCGACRVLISRPQCAGARRVSWELDWRSRLLSLCRGDLD